MDTIIFFRRKRQIRTPEAEPVGLKRYMLIRVELDVTQEQWFGERLSPGEDFGAGEEADGESGAGGSSSKRRRFPGLFWGYRKRRERREAQRERERLAAGREEQIRRVGADMGKLAALLREYAGEDSRCFAVYEDSLRTALTGKRRGGGDIGEEEFCPGETERGREKSLPVLWRRFLGLREFGDYCGAFWAEELLPEAVLPHFVVLGTAPVLYGMLEKWAGGMKSLNWILTEAECTGELLDFVEDFYVEYGLAISLRTLSGPAEYRRLGMITDKKSNIIDFIDDSGTARAQAPEGSIWLDMKSVEEKGRRITGRCAGIRYISLKEKWKYAQRRCNRPVLP